MEGRAAPEGALDPNPPAQQLGELSDDGEAQPRAAEASGVGVLDLGEPVEQDRDMRLGDARPGVPHRDPQNDSAVIQSGRPGQNFHGAGLGKLKGIAHQIEHDLPQAQGIDHQPVGDVIVDVEA